MSTKSTITHGEKHHLYYETSLDAENEVYLDLHSLPKDFHIDGYGVRLHLEEDVLNDISSAWERGRILVGEDEGLETTTYLPSNDPYNSKLRPLHKGEGLYMVSLATHTPQDFSYEVEEDTLVVYGQGHVCMEVALKGAVGFIVEEASLNHYKIYFKITLDAPVV